MSKPTRLSHSDSHNETPAHGLTAAVQTLRGVGPALAARLADADIHRIEDLLFRLPLRYEDRTRITPLGGAQAGQRCLVEGEVILAEVVFRGRRTLLVRIADGTGQLTLRFFHFSNAQRDRFVRGQRISCFGDARLSSGGLEMVHPEYRLLEPGSATDVDQRLTPVYPAIEGVSQNRLRQLLALSLATLERETPMELLSENIRTPRTLPTLREALHYLHAPPPDTDLAELGTGRHPCQRRLALEELVAHHVSLKLLRLELQSEPGIPVGASSRLRQQILASLPFSLTGAQARVLDDIARDMAQAVPMLRLVQGDVGSGKTIVAALAAAGVVEAGLQVAIMAPTELLAEQHLQSFTAWLEPLNIQVGWLTGSLRAAPRRAALAAIAGGTAQVVVGTHALFQDGVEFARLGLVIIDEQHRFGVHQRLALRDKGKAGAPPHQLVMTATPIPRTLAMTAYADLDTSVIDELPPGRTPVTTVVIPDERRGEVVTRVRDALADGRQAYWVCPLVEESDVLDAQAAESTAALLTESLPAATVGLVHGRMKAREKDAIMQQFKAGELQLLVATTVIEVGVDVPNASLMIIENAERMGLSQLHQLRGRVGRGAAASSCVLLYKAPLSGNAKARLAVLRDTNDGFVIAERDLELRGPGEVMGTRQTGAMNLRVADLDRDTDLLPLVHRAAGELLSDASEAGAVRIDHLLERWIGSASRYGNV
ncbi:MAG: ATP-dependent DNA helicase RecG [Pseudomonadota bacterium]